MQYLLVNGGYILRLVKGEEISSSIAEFAEKENLASGFFYGLGAIEHLELGHYYLEKKEFSWKTFPQELEIATLTGNITLVEGKPNVHMHGVFSSDSFECFGGHVRNGIVGATCEMYIVKFETPITRKMNEDIGLKLLDCKVE